MTFHIAMYFSMQLDRQLFSRDDMEVSGAGTHASKQCSLIF